MRKLLLLAVGGLLLLAAPPSYADWDPGMPAKWVQLPDLSPNGVDVYADSVRMLADDFECRETSLLTDVHFWGSWLGDQILSGINNIHLSIHSDDPVGPGGTNSDNTYSRSARDTSPSSNTACRTRSASASPI